ncbi:tetratricopeptide repeat protein [Deinococcus deserti]|uniref:Tetratricopeptide repeat protein n=1 Tax=Deinococcus deserti (strain DSM 17065 / CIP 109153 / LMG 22923 / VCD115) TaxID=546414 RepID=C1D0S1_DEIDV|nr:tetratricopeptide repeat protein [Deinococcus deserti]ACO45445.1 Conserved hypothetical protein; putative membrane protein [Deinococcus deserti VCD115]
MTPGSIFAQAPWLFTLFYILNIICLIHAVATRRGLLWIVFLGINLMFGGFLATLLYFFMEFLPSLRGSRRGAGIAVQRGVEAIKPLDTRIREAQARLNESDTLQNRADLAALLSRAGRQADAQAVLEPLLHGIYADDPVVLLTSAELDLQRGQPAEAEAKLSRVDLRTSAATRTRSLTLLARAQEAQGKLETAETYQQAMQGATSEEPRARYAAYLIRQGRAEEARPILEGLARTEQRATALYRRQEREWFQLAAGLRRELK